MNHAKECAYSLDLDADCDCGLSALLRRIAVTQHEATALRAQLASAEAVIEAATLHTHQCDSDADGKTDLCDAIEAHRARYPREAPRKGGEG